MILGGQDVTQCLVGIGVLMVLSLIPMEGALGSPLIPMEGAFGSEAKTSKAFKASQGNISFVYLSTSRRLAHPSLCKCINKSTRKPIAEMCLKLAVISVSCPHSLDFCN